MSMIMSFAPNMGAMDVAHVLATSLLSDEEPDDMLFADEAYLDDDLYAYGPDDEEYLQDLEEEYQDDALLVHGHIQHRFYGDEAISEYCLRNYLDHPIVDAKGTVTAWCEYLNERVQIGWIC